MAIPTIFTGQPSNVSGSSAELNASITDDGGFAITERGFYYGKISGNLKYKIVAGGATTGSFSEVVSGFIDGTYYFEGYAVNSDGEARGGEESFTIDDNTQKTIRSYGAAQYADFYTQGHKTRSGDFELIIHGADFDNVSDPADGYLEVEEVGDIKYDFDVPDSEEDPTSIRLNAGSIEVTLWDQVKDAIGGGYRSLHETLYNADSSRFPFEATVKFEKGIFKYLFQMQFDYDDIGYDFETRKVTLELSVASNVTGDLPTKLVDYLDLNDSDTYRSYEGQIAQANIYDGTIHKPAYGLLEDALDELNPSLAKELSTDVFTTANLDAEPTFWLFGGEFSNLNYIPYDDEGVDDMTIIKQMAVMAALEGAVYGQGFGKSFYINRQKKDPAYERTISFDTIEELEIVERRNANLNYVESNVLLRWFAVPNTFSESFNDNFSTVSINREYYSTVRGDKYFEANFSLGAMMVGGLVYVSTEDEDFVTFTDENDEFTNFENDVEALFNSLTSSSVPAYAAAVGASAPLRIKVVGWGIFSLKPYEWFNFSGSNVPPILANKDFRVSEISYDSITDKYEVEAYQF